MSKKIEILAPAGSMEGLKAAVNAGCDAVYIGGSKFGARAYANNLDEEQLLEAIDFVHLHGKSLYLTVNTLFKKKELEEELYPYLENLYKHGLDAVIVQDIGAIHFIHRHFPNLPIHASTQMTLTMERGADVFKDLGVTRLVTSRELSLSEIRSIRDHTDIEIESFVHGALCYCYSGQCFMSSMLGGRSGNRGRCAQTCRMPYKVVMEGKEISKEEDKYILSPKDICTLFIIPELIEAGIDSFKIEGRMKKPEYAALVTSIYRKYVDLYFELGNEKYKEYIAKNKKSFDEDVRMLMDLYNRGSFTNGYYEVHNSKNMMSMKRPNHSGVLVGEVTFVKGNKASIRLQEEVSGQDILEIRSNEESIYEFTLKNGAKKGDTIQTNFMVKSMVKPNFLVYRTRNDRLLNEVKDKYIKEDIKEVIAGEFTARLGKEMTLSLYFRGITITKTGDIVESSLKQPMTREKISSQLNKMNTTPFQFKSLEVHLDEQIFIPVVKLNEIRREAVESLIEAVLKQYRREANLDSDISSNYYVNKKEYEILENNSSTIGKPRLNVHLIDTTMVKEVLQHKEVDSIYLDSTAILFPELLKIASEIKRADRLLYIVLPHVFRKEIYEEFVTYREILTNTFIDGYIVKNFEELDFVLKDLKAKELGKEIILDYNVYTLNQEAKEFYKENGVSHFTSSIELNSFELKELGCKDADIIVYGHLPLMVSAQCVLKNTKGCVKNIPVNKKIAKDNNSNATDLRSKSQTLKLLDRKKKPFYVRNYCNYCYNLIYNGQPISLLTNQKEIMRLSPLGIRLDFTFENKEKIHEVIQAFTDVFVYDRDTNIEISDYTRGHFKRGIE